MPRTAAHPEFGDELREWRQRRRFSQLALASEAEVSQRHLSYLETGRSRPSREMVIHLSTVLEIPLRERNRMLVAAGFAPEYRERALDGPDLERVRHVLEFIVRAHEPFPAVVVDRRWDVVLANDAAVLLTIALVGADSPFAFEPNLARLALHPDGARRNTTNWSEAATSFLDRLRREAAEQPSDPALAALVAEVEAYPDVAGLPRRLAPGADDLLLPVRYRLGGDEVTLHSTIATLGAAYDVTLEELRLETFFPADEASERALRSLAGGGAGG